MEHASDTLWYFDKSADQRFAETAQASAAKAGIYANVTGEFDPETRKITYTAITITMEQHRELAAELAANPDTEPAPIPTETTGHLTMRSALQASMRQFDLLQNRNKAQEVAHQQWGYRFL